jgi:hypothetical protein
MRNDDADGFFAAIGKNVVGAGCATILVPLIAIPMSAYGALFYLPLWRWFVVPLGGPDMAFWQFVGLRLLWSALLPHAWIKPEYQQPFQHQFASALVAPLMTLGLGAIVHFWLL